MRTGYHFGGKTAREAMIRQQFRIQNSKSEKSRKKFIGGPAGWRESGAPTPDSFHFSLSRNWTPPRYLFRLSFRRYLHRELPYAEGFIPGKTLKKTFDARFPA
jgi:hypothetical protein